MKTSNGAERTAVYKGVGMRIPKHIYNGRAEVHILYAKAIIHIF